MTREMRWIAELPIARAARPQGEKSGLVRAEDNANNKYSWMHAMCARQLWCLDKHTRPRPQTTRHHDMDTRVNNVEWGHLICTCEATQVFGCFGVDFLLSWLVKDVFAIAMILVVVWLISADSYESRCFLFLVVLLLLLCVSFSVVFLFVKQFGFMHKTACCPSNCKGGWSLRMLSSAVLLVEASWLCVSSLLLFSTTFMEHYMRTCLICLCFLPPLAVLSLYLLIVGWWADVPFVSWTSQRFDC